jgi:hypothetical protein
LSTAVLKLQLELVISIFMQPLCKSRKKHW